MTLAWLHRAADELELPHPDQERVIRLLEPHLSISYQSPELVRDATRADLRRASRLVELMKDAEWPPYLRARAEIVAELLDIALEDCSFAAKAQQPIVQSEVVEGDAAFARAIELASLDIPDKALAVLRNAKPGPFDVLLLGTKRSFDEDAMEVELQKLGYDGYEADRMIRRALHIDEPQELAYLLDEDAAIELKLRLEAVGAKAKIRRHKARRSPRQSS